MKKNIKSLENRLLNYSLYAGLVLCSSGTLQAQLATLGPGIGSYAIDFDGGGNELVVYFSNVNAFWLTSIAGGVSLYGNPNGGFPIPYALTSGNILPTGGTKWGTGTFAYLDQGGQGSFQDATFSNKFFGIRFDGNSKFGWVKLSLTGTQLIINDAQYGATPPSPLPVELTNFTAKISDSYVKLNWETATEVDNYGFEIERATPVTTPFKGWEKIGFVPGHGNSNSPKQYEFVDNNIAGDSLEYRLKQIDTDGSFIYFTQTIKVGGVLTDVEGATLPTEFNLGQNYPNPFNPSTLISYQVSANSFIQLKVFDLLGREVAVLVNKQQPAGKYNVEFTAPNLPSGAYVYKLSTNTGFVESKKLVLIK